MNCNTWKHTSTYLGNVCYTLRTTRLRAQFVQHQQRFIQSRTVTCPNEFGRQRQDEVVQGGSPTWMTRRTKVTDVAEEIQSSLKGR